MVMLGYTVHTSCIRAQYNAFVKPPVTTVREIPSQFAPCHGVIGNIATSWRISAADGEQFGVMQPTPGSLKKLSPEVDSMSLGLFGARVLLRQQSGSFSRMPVRCFGSKPPASKEGEVPQEKHEEHAPFNWGSDSSYVPGREYLRETGERANRGMVLCKCSNISIQVSL